MKLIHLLRFMDKAELKELATKILNDEVQGVKLVLLYPFLDRDDLDEIVDLLIEKGHNKNIYSALPFMSKATLNKLFEKVKSGEIKDFKEQALLPFLGKDKIKELFDEYVKQAHNQSSSNDEADVSELFDDEEK